MKKRIFMRSLLKHCAGLIPIAFFERLSVYSMHRRQFSRILAAKRFADRTLLWQHSVRQLKCRKLLVLEFGVFQGESIRTFASLNEHPDSEFYGFDSFEGLPESWHSLEKGHFSTHGAVPAVSDSRIQFVKGWFQDTLPGFLDEKRELLAKSGGEDHSVLVHFDADLYSSTLYLLTMLHARLPGYAFVFDEFTGQESRAMYNYISAYNPAYDFTGCTVRDGYPWQVAGRLSRR